MHTFINVSLPIAILKYNLFANEIEHLYPFLFLLAKNQANFI